MKMAKLLHQRVPFLKNDSVELSADIVEHATIFIIRHETSVGLIKNISFHLNWTSDL